MKQRTNRREWSRRVSEWRRSGKTSKEFAAATGVNASTLLWWSAKLGGERGGRAARRPRRAHSHQEAELGAKLPIVEVRGAFVDDRFELVLGDGRRLRIPPGFDADALGRLLAVLG